MNGRILEGAFGSPERELEKDLRTAWGRTYWSWVPAAPSLNFWMRKDSRQFVWRVRPSVIE